MSLPKIISYATEQEHSKLFAAPTFVPGTLISLRKLTAHDLPEYYELLQDKRCTDLFFIATDGTVPSVDSWYYMHYQLMSQWFGERIVYSVIINATGKIGGMIELIRDSVATRGHVSGLAHPNYWGLRMGLETVKLASKVFFDLMPLNTLYSHVVSSNHRAQTFNLKCGFEFSHISQEAESKNDLVFVMYRPK